MWDDGSCLVLWKVSDALALGGVGPRGLGKGLSRVPSSSRPDPRSSCCIFARQGHRRCLYPRGPGTCPPGGAGGAARGSGWMGGTARGAGLWVGFSLLFVSGQMAGAAGGRECAPRRRQRDHPPLIPAGGTSQCASENSPASPGSCASTRWWRRKRRLSRPARARRGCRRPQLVEAAGDETAVDQIRRTCVPGRRRGFEDLVGAAQFPVLCFQLADMSLLIADRAALIAPVLLHSAPRCATPVGGPLARPPIRVKASRRVNVSARTSTTNCIARSRSSVGHFL